MYFGGNINLNYQKPATTNETDLAEKIYAETRSLLSMKKQQTIPRIQNKVKYLLNQANFQQYLPLLL